MARRRLFCVAAATALWLSLPGHHAGAQAIQGPITVMGPRQPVPPTLFDLNIIAMNERSAWPTVPFGGWRTFHFRWFDVEPQPGNWNWAQTDFEIQAAEQHHVQLLPILQGVPVWADRTEDPALAESNPSRQAQYRCMPASAQLYAAYVRAVATRYKGRIHAYELWNEPLGVPCFASNIASVVALNKIAARELKLVDPTITVVSSAYSSGDPVRARPFAKLDEFARAGGFDDADVIGFHHYEVPMHGQTATVPPEALLDTQAQLAQVLRRYGIHKPIWSTEIGWATLNDGPSTVAIPADLGTPLDPYQAAGYVARAFLLGWATGIERMYWFSWRQDYYGLTQKDGSQKATSVAYATTASWMIGSVLEGCSRDVGGIWTCTLKSQSGRWSHVLWAEQGQYSFEPPANWHVSTVQRLDGAPPTPRTGPVTVNGSPILLSPSL